MSRRGHTLATAFYRSVAKLSAKMLIGSPDVESVLLHRSAATGEVNFGRSDIDLMMVISEEAAESGLRLAALLEQVRRARRFNPVLSHIDVCDRRGLDSHSRQDTFRASMERRTLMLLCGRPVEIPDLPVDPDHGLEKFLVWLEVFFSASLQRKDRRNVRKISLECWNAYASAIGSEHPPSVLRSEMEARACAAERELEPERLQDFAYAAGFVFRLAQRLHERRRPPLRKLQRTLIVDSIVAPLCMRRRLVILPQPESALPDEVFHAGAFPCTPEILDLFVHARNAFYSWSLPQELADAGIEPPSAAEFIKACRSFGHERFLLAPGFLVEGPTLSAVRCAVIAHAMEALQRGEAPSPMPQAKLLELMQNTPGALDYYRTQYDGLRQESRRFTESLVEGHF